MASKELKDLLVPQPPVYALVRNTMGWHNAAYEHALPFTTSVPVLFTKAEQNVQSLNTPVYLRITPVV